VFQTHFEEFRFGGGAKEAVLESSMGKRDVLDIPDANI
jgi:hypothetical protein